MRIPYWAIAAMVVLSLCTVTGCLSTEQIEQKAYRDVLDELETAGNPPGMLGVEWYMTQAEVSGVLGNSYRLDADTLAQETDFCGRPATATFHFDDNLLMMVVVAFDDYFQSPDEFADAFYGVQDCLSFEYGSMPEPNMEKAVPPIDGEWPDQTFMESQKNMGRTTLVHHLLVRNNSMGEQVGMYLAGIEQ